MSLSTERITNGDLARLIALDHRVVRSITPVVEAGQAVLRCQVDGVHHSVTLTGVCDQAIAQLAGVNHLPVLEQWIGEYFTDYVKIDNVYYRPDQYVSVDEGSCISHHQVAGTLFMRDTKTCGQWGVNEYSAIDDSPALLDAVRRGIRGASNSIYYHTLVRRSIPGGWKYYPLPLVFADYTARLKAAEAQGNTPPPNRWIARRRLAVETLLQLEPTTA